jgi:DNA invertase Pin-like site-specific DNA recombinase
MTSSPSSTVPAAQYLRMSTEHQRYSCANQAAAIAEYAARRGYDLQVSYFDAGKSGLTLRERGGLQAMMAAALDRARPFQAILVLDVSRWGRFQDVDESAHYEFLCRAAGVDVVYCGEPFENDGSPGTALIKQMKRVMAAEFSRELSAKVARARRQQALLGFHQGGSLPYGVRRLIVDARGRPRANLEPGERKAFSSDRVVLVHGPPEEIATVRRIYRRFVEDGRALKTIARELNARGTPATYGRPWTAWQVRTVLTHEIMIGVYVFGRTRRRLKLSPRLELPSDEWVRVPMMAPIVSPRLHRRAAERLALPNRREKLENKAMLGALKRLLRARGRLSGAIIDASQSAPPSSAYKRHFGTLAKAYAAIGYTPRTREWPGIEHAPATDADLLDLLKRLHAKHGYICGRLIDEAPDLPSHQLYMKRFGSLTAAFEKAGVVTCSQKEAYLRSIERGTAAICTGALGIPRGSKWADGVLLDGLRRLAARDGKVNCESIDADPNLPSASTYVHRFGSLLSAYALVGLPATKREIWSRAMVRRHRERAAARVGPAAPAGPGL